MIKKDLTPKIVKNIIHGPDPCNTTINLTHKNIYIFPSKMGIIWSFLLFVMFLIGLNYRNNVVLLLTFFLISCSIISLIYTFFQLYDLEISPTGMGKPVFQGEKGVFLMNIKERRGIHRYLKIVCGDYSRDFFIKPNSAVLVEYKVKTQKRGILKSPKFHLISYYPFGIFRCWTVLRFNDIIVVYPSPRPHLLPSMSIKQDPFLSEGGKNIGVEDFCSLENYTPPEPSSRIYWKIYAKKGELVKKVYQSEGAETIWLDLKDYQHMGTEIALGILCFLILECHKMSIEYGLRLDNFKLEPGLGEEHKHMCLKRLALYPEY